MLIGNGGHALADEREEIIIRYLVEMHQLPEMVERRLNSLEYVCHHGLLTAKEYIV